MNFRKIDLFYIISFLYILISFILGIILRNGLVMFLGVNIFLATISYVLSKVFLKLLKDKVKDLWIILCLILYILFFPNTIYVLTDFIHFQNYDYFIQYSNIYNYEIYDWLVFTHIVIGALYAAKLGITSIHNLEIPFKPLLKKYYYTFLLGLFILSSIAIYIGRFIRLNSWQFFRIDLISSHILNNLLFFIAFILMFTLIHIVTYFVFSKTSKNNI
jgi:uncharacterized membrane protein